MLQIVALPIALVSSRACGEPHFINSLHRKIIGGTPAPIEQFPYMVSLQVEYGIVRFHICGGSIISPLWVLTADHCNGFYSASAMLTRVGSISEATGSELRKVREVFRHPNFSVGVGLDNDIALIKGDSSGPLVAAGKVVGVVSWGLGCALPNAPGEYARVAHSRQWISSISGL